VSEGIEFLGEEEREREIDKNAAQGSHQVEGAEVDGCVFWW